MAKKVFISYRRADPDQKVAEDLQESIANAGFTVFRDGDTPIGVKWAEEIQRNGVSVEWH